MSLEFGCAWCGASFARRGQRNDHEEAHVAAERRDEAAEGATACAAGVPLSANPWPASTWPAIRWAEGWERESMQRRAA